MARLHAFLCTILIAMATMALLAQARVTPATPARGPAAAVAKPPARQSSLTTAELFQTSRVWSVHLTFTRDQWNALRPRANGFGGGGGDGFLAAEGHRNGISGQRGLDFQYVHAAIELDTWKFNDVAVRFKGNGTYTAGEREGKISFKVDLNKFVKGQKIGGVSTLNLHSNVTDPTWMNEVLAYRLYRDAGAPAPRTAYARVFVTVPGLLQHASMGLYTLVENVDEAFAEDRFKEKAGAIFKPVTESIFSDKGRDWRRYNQTYDPKTDLTPADQQRIMDLCDLVTRANDQTYAARLPEFIDLDAFATHMAVVVWLANPDSILQQGQNYYMYLHPKTRKLAFVPWDQDHSFGMFGWSSDSQQQRLDILRPWTRANRFLERTFKLEAFRKLYLTRLAALTRTLTQPDRLTQQFDELAAVIAPLVAQDPLKDRAALFKRAQANQSYTRVVYGGTVTPMKTFVRLRQAAVLQQLKALGVQ